MGQGGNKEYDGVGYRDWDPAQESGAGIPAERKGSELLSVFMCSRTGLEKTKSTCLGTEDLQQRVVSDAGYP